MPYKAHGHRNSQHSPAEVTAGHCYLQPLGIRVKAIPLHVCGADSHPLVTGFEQKVSYCP